MSGYLGFDTSNYTTSVSFVDRESDAVSQCKRLLPVKDGQLGLRQSDAVFHHTRQLPELVEDLFRQISGDIVAVAASDRPQQVEGSYMPCFLVGTGAARQLASVLKVPFYRFTHQQGHVMAALTGAGCLDWVDRPFLAFHVSGGTTDALLVEPDEKEMFRCRVVGRSLDLKAGQLVDRVGGMLGLSFPAGPALEKLALQADQAYRPRASLQEGNCHLSGVENQCRKRLEQGNSPAQVARFCLDSIAVALAGMTEKLFEQYGSLPLVYAGGVMSNSLLREKLSAQFGGRFAPPAYSSDNAVGIACLCRLMEERR